MPCRENSNKHSAILTTKLSTHQTKQPKSFQETTIVTDVTSSEQDLKNPQLIIIPMVSMLKPPDITQTTFDALNNAATVVYEATYEAVSDAVSEVDASHFHELSRKTQLTSNEE